jgi:mono/diheme cytochrome c family protein
MKKYFIFIVVLSFMIVTPIKSLFSEIGTAWGPASFKTNGERIYFTSTSDRDARITYRGGLGMGMMRMHGRLTCASCHGPSGRGGKHVMHMHVMDTPDIRWSALSEEQSEHREEEGEDDGHEHEHGEYTFEMFKMAVIEGTHPDGKTLKNEMPRWRMSGKDLTDLAGFLKSLP